MLILSRSIGQKITIGDKKIEITLLNVKGRRVSFGIVAPKYITVHREEVYLRIHADKIKKSEENKK